VRGEPGKNKEVLEDEEGNRKCKGRSDNDRERKKKGSAETEGREKEAAT